MRLVVLIAGLATAFSLQAQDIKYCGQTQQTEALFQHFPQAREEAQLIKEEAKRLKEEYRVNQRGDEETLYVPVVFHIIHDGGPENISDEQVYSAMEILNRDMRRLNEDIEDVVPAFEDITADVNIEFRLAKRDPQGNCTKGINRVQSALTYEGNSAMKQLSYWPRDMYLNVWVCAEAGGAAGYTFLPQSVNNNPTTDGIVLLHDYTGDMGTSNVFRSRTLTHEVGHWIGLPHPWGGTNSPGLAINCQDDDGIDDTPNTEGWTSCILDGESCGSLDNVQNYMDYSYCTRMFTQDQKDEMRFWLQHFVSERDELITDDNHSDTGIFEEDVLCDADFTADKLVVCQGEEVQFFDQSFHDVISWEWDFGNFTVEGTDEELDKNPVVIFEEPGTYSVTLTVSNGFETIQEVKQNYLMVLPSGGLASPFQDGFESGLSDTDWFVWNEHDNVTWEETSVASFSGDRCLRIRNRNNNIEFSNDQLVSNTFDLTGAAYATISYKWAYVNLPVETDDRLRVSVSANCGDNWSLRDIHRGITDLPTADPQNAPFVPENTSEWAENMVTVDNPDFMGPNFRVMFDFEGRGGNHIYLDDINITVYDDANNITQYFNDFAFTLAPNPAKELTTLKYYLPVQSEVTIALHDMMGRRVQTISEGSAVQGEHVTEIQRQGLANGMYLVTMQIGEKVYTQRLMLQ